jgi:hypothetical protein
LSPSESEISTDRVRARTDPAVNRWIDQETEHRLSLYAHQRPELIRHRLRELDQEWDIERVLETNASSMILGTLTLGALVSRKWFVVPFAVAGFLLQHAVQGWCPPLNFFRKRGVRTSREIERERCALRALLEEPGVPVSKQKAAPVQAEEEPNGTHESRPRTRRH